MTPTYRTLLLAALACGLPRLAGAATTPAVLNPGLETATADKPTVPEHWWSIGAPGSVALDASTRRSGERSLRLVRSGDFVGIGQTLDVGQASGRKVELRAWFRAEGVGEGTAGLWLRVDDANGKVLGFASSYDTPVESDGAWHERRVLIAVPGDAAKLVFGATQGSTGTLWVDDVELRVMAPAAPGDTAPAAIRYLDDALDLIQARAYRSTDVDWPKVRAEAHRLAAGAKSSADTHEAIAYALNALGDGHSSLMTPRKAQAVATDARTTGFGIHGEQKGRVGYVRVPGYAGGNPARQQAFTDELRGHLDRQRAAGSCGWIVDLREDTGGNMYPMLAGLQPLLGTGTLGYFVSREGRHAWDAGAAAPRAADWSGTEPVAVLVGPRTASSGEAVFISFIGRANTRSFGQPSGGYSSANEPQALADGAMMALTTALMADREGRVHEGRLAPDVEVAAQAGVPAESDGVVRTAGRWLLSQAGCRSAASTGKATSD